eukprot:6409633-Amphidinium_carterae.1
MGERYRTEFESELRTVRHQVEMLQKAHSDNDIVTALKDEVLCERQHRALEGQRLEEALEASSSPRFNKIDTPDFGVQALNVTMD